MLNRHFREFIELLEKHEVRYLVVGGYAVGYHGFPRYTGDLDIFIGISEEIGREPLKIQVLTGIDGVTFDECFEGKVLFDAGEGLRIPFIGFENLLKNKEASPRAKDKIDFEELKRIKG